MQSSMLTTQEFIKRKCSKDHLSSLANSHGKHTSVYSIDYKSKAKMRIIDPNVDHLGKERNTHANGSNAYLLPPTSVYRNSYEKGQTPTPVKYHQRPCFFLKTESYEPMQSSYNRSSIMPSNVWNDKDLKGKPSMDNLFVAKYNKMNTNSLYHDSYHEFTKLPSVHKEKREKTGQPQRHKLCLR